MTTKSRSIPSLRLKRTATPETHERLERLKRWPSLRQKWNGKKVRIWSGEHDSYWRPNYQGYVIYESHAGIYDFEDAYAHTQNCDPSKQIEFKAV